MSLPARPGEATDYIAPEIIDYGDLAELTAGLNRGGPVDAAFPMSPPRRDPTFSTP
jgi:hypothetical protein